MKYILILFFVFGCQNKKVDDYKTYIICGADTVIMDDYGNTDVSKASSTHGYIDTVNKILYIEVIKPKSFFIPQGLWETSNEGYLIKRDTIFLNMEAIPSGTSIQGEGVDKSIIRLRDTLKDYPITIHGGDSLPYKFTPIIPIGFMPDSIWITNNEVRNSWQYTATYDSLGNIYFKEK